MRKIKFYSEYDMSCGININRIIDKINENVIQNDWFISDFIEFYNILKYLAIDKFADYIVEQTDIDINAYIKRIKQKLGEFVGRNKDNFVSLYDEKYFIDVEDFLEIIEKYNIYKEISNEEFKALLSKKKVNAHIVLKFQKITEHFDAIIKEKIIRNSKYAETIVSKYLKKPNLYLPPSLTEKEILDLINDYIDSSDVNINVLRQIITFPKGKGLNITDKIILHAKRKAKAEEEKIFKNSSGIERSISISYPMDQIEACLFNMDERAIDVKVSRKWLEENLDYPTLWNNFIYVFRFVDDKFRLVFVSKTNEIDTIEALIRPSGDHLYSKSYVFDTKEMIGNLAMVSYIKELWVLGVRIEDMIEWFFNTYLKEEFSINNFIVRMPSGEASYFDKCRTILPEIDRIFKQYNLFIEEGEIDQELIQISSSSFKINDIMSFNHKKYIYPMSTWYEIVSHLLFSDQSGLSYMPDKTEQRENFLDLIINVDVTKNDFEEYQLQDMKWLFENKIIYVDENDYIRFNDINKIYVLYELYYEDVLSYWHCPDEIKNTIDDLLSNDHICSESTLLSRNEQDYFDFYLNKAKYTNGYDLRNRYLHGTNCNDERQYEIDYYSILKLIVIIIIKINDDLCIRSDNDEREIL